VTPGRRFARPRRGDRLSLWNWRAVVVTGALVGTVLVSAAGAWAVRDSWLDHQRAVEATLDEHATYAARTFAREIAVQNVALRLRSLAPVLGASALGAAALGEADGLTLAGVTAFASAVLDPEVGLADDPWRGFFRLDLATGRHEATGRAADAVVADALGAMVRDARPALDTAQIPRRGLLRLGGETAAVIYAMQRTSAGVPVAVYGYTLSHERSGDELAAGVVRRTSLLPPSLLAADSGDVAASLDTPVQVWVTDTTGHELFRTPGAFTSDAYGAFESGGGLTMHAMLHPALADRLRRQMLSDDRRRLQVALPILSLLLAAATILHLRRERELVRARRDFVASVSHELRTPLAQIRMFSETLLLGREEDEEERLRWTAVIGREARRLGDLVENILLFSHIDAARVRLEPERTDLGELVEEAVEAYVPVAASRRMRIVADAPSRIYAVVDPRALRQVVVNLLDNALKYGPAGQTVSVEVERDGTWARLLVSDQGPGVAPADRARLWRPFVRLGAEGSTSGGSGIGLSVVRSLVAQHGGTVAVDDAPGGGARFVIALPLAEGAPPPRTRVDGMATAEFPVPRPAEAPRTTSGVA
jgi:signal transduction histidine kinase